MNQHTGTRLLAIAVDAAEPEFVRRLIDRGEMPALGALLREGTWLRVKSPAYIGSGCIWPSFMSAQSPQTHGVYGEWLWDARTMSLSRYHGNDLIPFWKAFVDDDFSVGILDVPFMPMIGITKGFEISEWGPHDILNGRMQLAPETVAATVAEHSPHPLEQRVQISGPDDYRSLELVGKNCLQGLQKRGELAHSLLRDTQPQFAIVAFTEVHRSAHYLWHKTEPENPIYAKNGIAKLSATRPSIDEIYRELDRQINKLITAAGPNARIVVFSLHGMRPAHGTPAFLADWLCEKGFARMPGWRDQNWSERATAVFGAVKRGMPESLKKIYYKTVPPTVTHQLARPTMLPLYDWSRTRAFALPTDQHGWIRINLEGREARGIVAKESYDQTRDSLESELRNLRSADGEFLVSNVVRTSASVEDAMNLRIPDLIVHWSDAVFAKPLRLCGSQIEPQFDGRKYVGQHGLEGFSIAPDAFDYGDEIRAEEMHALFSRILQHSA
jgi:predicted AlkP superfamily phosphohydrolase/phosphomutase